MNIKENIKEAFTDNKNLLLISVILFSASLIIGYTFQPVLYNIFNPVVEQLSRDVKNKVIQLTFHDIFLNNIMIVFRMFIFGILFCFSILLLMYNGFFLGYYIGCSKNLVNTLLLIIPHAIFELPSIVIATTSGLVLFKFAYNVFKNINSMSENSLKEKIITSFEKYYYILKESLVLLLVSAILMAVAGVIETHFTISIAKWLISLF